MSKLSPRQWALYRYLVERGDQWTKQEEIAYELPEWYCQIDKDDFHSTKARRTMSKDIMAINNSTVIQKIIISHTKYGIKLATEDEWRQAIKREYASVFNKLKRIRHKEHKGYLNGQMRLVFKTERDTIESFLRDE
jgi:hypothetical protein